MSATLSQVNARPFQSVGGKGFTVVDGELVREAKTPTKKGVARLNVNPFVGKRVRVGTKDVISITPTNNTR